MSDSKKKIGKYTNAVLLAKGGMGAIYKADHPTLEQPVVLKMLTLTGNEQFTQRFQREATIMMGFQHVNIVNYYDHFKTAKSYCMVMEFVDGCSVAQLLDKQRYLDDDVALLILKNTLQALVFAHERGVVHRDIKPANILISKKGDVKLTDFGIAHNTEIDADGLTKEGMTLGTPSYMAPEQFRDAGSVDGRADIYSSGILLYECLTGRKPFAGASLPDLLEHVRKSKYERLRKIRPESSLLSRRLIRRAIRSKPERRYKDAMSMLNSLKRYFARRNEESIRRYLADLVSDRRVNRKTSRVDKRRIIRIGLISAGSLAALLLLTGIWWTLAVNGFLPAFLLPDFIGGVRLEVPLPENTILSPHVLLDVYQYDTEAESNEKVKEIKIGLNGREPLHDRFSRFLESRKAQDEENPVPLPPGVTRLHVRPVFVKPGFYQLKVRVGDVISTKAIQIPSMKDLRKSLDYKGRQVPLVDLSIPWQPKTGPVFVTWKLHRSDTGLELTDYPEPSVLGADGVAYAVSGKEVELNTGRYYDFTFNVSGFESRRVRAWLESGISDYTIELSLLPEPAVLSLSSALVFKKPKLQGEGYYRYGGSEGGFRRTPFLAKDAKVLVLLPGEYRLSCGSRGKSAEIELNLEPGDAFSYRLERSEDKKLVWIKENEVISK
ncbi:MAG: serine/threonine protein kinase [Spirochaetaceae bacterium]|nr:serine/threonine protein kinase [Spirochaetaceae bacterium]